MPKEVLLALEDILIDNVQVSCAADSDSTENGLADLAQLRALTLCTSLDDAWVGSRNRPGTAKPPRNGGCD